MTKTFSDRPRKSRRPSLRTDAGGGVNLSDFALLIFAAPEREAFRHHYAENPRFYARVRDGCKPKSLTSRRNWVFSGPVIRSQPSLRTASRRDQAGGLARLKSLSSPGLTNSQLAPDGISSTKSRRSRTVFRPSYYQHTTSLFTHREAWSLCPSLSVRGVLAPPSSVARIKRLLRGASGV